MTNHENKKVVIDAWGVFASRDPARIAEVFAEDAEWLAPERNATAVALGGPSHLVGREAIAQFIGFDFHRLFVADVSIRFRNVFADGDTVIVENQLSATLPDGRTYSNDYCFFFEVRDGTIWRVREYMDTRRGQELILGA
jgi:ketosteroid isomerase-like protein